MNQWRDDTTIKQEQKQPTENKDYPQILENQIITSKIESQNVSIVKHMDIQYETARNQRKRKILTSAMSVEKSDILLKTAKRRKIFEKKRIQMMMMMTTNRRVLAKIPSRYGTKDPNV